MKNMYLQRCAPRTTKALNRQRFQLLFKRFSDLMFTLERWRFRSVFSCLFERAIVTTSFDNGITGKVLLKYTFSKHCRAVLPLLSCPVRPVLSVMSRVTC
jgi:hypothetical protein